MGEERKNMISQYIANGGSREQWKELGFDYLQFIEIQKGIEDGVDRKSVV